MRFYDALEDAIRRAKWWQVSIVAAVVLGIVVLPGLLGGEDSGDDGDDAEDVPLLDEDDFSTDTITEGLWEFTPPSPGNDEEVEVTGGQLAPTTTLEKHLYRPGASMGDGVVTAKFTTGTNDVGHGRVSGKHDDAGDYWVAFDFNIATNLTRLRYHAPNPVGSVDFPTGGVTGGVLATSTSYWAQIEFDGNDLEGRLYAADPFGSPAPTPISTRTGTLTDDDADALGEGVFGHPGLAFFSPTDLNWRADDFRAEGVAGS